MKRALVLLVALLSGQLLAQTKTYIALGDSIAFGFQPNDYSRGSGDKGYVKPFADWVGTQQGGVRPVLFNLAIPGETSASFYDTSEVGALLNSNYPLIGRRSQADTFATKVASELSKGHVVTHVTCAIGGNDLLDLLTSQFLSLPFDQQKALADQALLTADTNVVRILGLVRQQCPFAKVLVPGYYNPYHAFPGSPADLIATYAIPRLNGLLFLRARQFGAGFAETYTPFVGRELELTWIGQDDVHPRDAGYAVLAQRLVARAQQPIVAPLAGGVHRD